MKLVVSDASPIRYLVAIDAVHILPDLFSKVDIPEHVVTAELQGRRTPTSLGGPHVGCAHESHETTQHVGPPSRNVNAVSGLPETLNSRPICLSRLLFTCVCPAVLTQTP
jgi:hypothetical protein